MFHDILVYLGESRHAEAALEVAAALAKQSDAHLCGLYAMPYFLTYNLQYTEALSLEEISESYEKEAKARATEAKARFEASSWLSGVTSEWRYVRGMPPQELRDHGKYADLIVVAQPTDDDFSELRDLADTALLESGRPVLIVPQRNRPFSSFRKVLVAWNGSRESARALNDALPLLQQADSVTILSIGKKKTKDALPSADISLHLARCGVKASAEMIETKTRPAGEEILVRAVDMGADLVVSGAYGHARLREVVLGGATRFLLHNSSLPLFMSH